MSDSANPKAYVKLKVSPDPGIEFNLDAMTATEELGRPFLISLDVSSGEAKADLKALLGSSVTVTLTKPTESDRYFNGFLAKATYAGLSGGAFRYRMELRPWIWLLGSIQDCCIFSDQSVWTTITGIFRDAGFTNFRDGRNGQAGEAVLVHCVQYRETSLDFVTRLMEEFGIYYFAEHADGQHTLVLADDPNSHTSLSTAIPFRLDQTEHRSVEDHLWDWSGEAQIEPGAHTLRDYNFTTPAADLTTKSLLDGGHPHGSGEVYDYPGDYQVTGDGTKLADIRMQARAARRQTYSGTSNARGLGTGKKFTLSEFHEASLNQEYLVTSCTCSITIAEALALDDGELIDTFQCVLEAIPGTVPFRLENLTPRPMIRGPQTAKVAGESGQEITTDQYGRIKVKFPWDRRAAEDENSSCWIRVAQIWAGVSWGAMFIPRIGQEVVVEYLEGNPDRPIVTGQVYNATVTVPYALPANKTRSTIKSNSSLNGGGFNELRFEDLKDSEEVFFQAQKDYNKVVLNNETVKVTQDTTTTVLKGNRSVTVQTGNDTHTVDKGDRSTTVTTGNDSHTVTQGNRTATVSQGNEALTVSKGNRTATVSTGNDTTTVSAGDHLIDVTAANSTISAGTSITLKVGGNSIKIEQGGITIKAVKITITADTALEMSGLTGKLSGSTKLDLDGGAMATLTGGLVKIN